MLILAAITGALRRWPLLAVLALRRNGRLAPHPVLLAKISHLFLDEYLALNPRDGVDDFDPTKSDFHQTIPKSTVSINKEEVMYKYNNNYPKAVDLRIPIDIHWVRQKAAA